MEASEEFEKSSGLRSEVTGHVTQLINESSLEDLEKMLQSTAGSHYEPHSTYQMASLYLEDNQLEKAKAYGHGLGSIDIRTTLGLPGEGLFLIE